MKEPAGAGRNKWIQSVEDKVMKTAAPVFGEDLLPYIGVKGKIPYSCAYGHVHLEMRTQAGREILISSWKRGAIQHLEFESDCITEQDFQTLPGI